jgi:hypothetical protein
MQARVTGISGISTENYSASFAWNKTEGDTVSGTFKKEINYFDLSQKEFVINFTNFELLPDQLNNSGINR